MDYGIMSELNDATGLLYQAKSRIGSCAFGSVGAVTDENRQILGQAYQQIDEIVAALMGVCQGS